MSTVEMVSRRVRDQTLVFELSMYECGVAVRPPFTIHVWQVKVHVRMLIDKKSNL